MMRPAPAGSLNWKGALPSNGTRSRHTPMSGKTGNRCAIYDKIDALDEARTVAELVAKLKPVLNELAYYAVNGEAAVLEAHEEWRGNYADALYAEMGAEHAAAMSGQRSPPSAGGGSGARPSRGRKTRGGAAGHDRPPGPTDRMPMPPPSNRPRPDAALPPSLRAIMDGTHASLSED